MIQNVVIAAGYDAGRCLTRMRHNHSKRQHDKLVIDCDEKVDYGQQAQARSRSDHVRLRMLCGDGRSGVMAAETQNRTRTAQRQARQA